MAIFRVMVVIPADTAVGRDAVVNTWGVAHNGDFSGVSADVTAKLKTFYDSMSTYRANSHNWAASMLKAYDLSQPKPRAPVYEGPIALSATSSTGNTASELAICMSFQAVRASGEPQGRKRGRVYLGPWGSLANDGVTGRPENALLLQIKNAGQVLLDASEAATWSWVVISTVNPAVAASSIVNNGWVDNSWDVQRRRGVAPTFKHTFT